MPLQGRFEAEGARYYRQVCRAWSSFACCCQTGILADVLFHVISVLVIGEPFFHSENVTLPQEVPEKNKESPGGPWQFVGLLPLFDPPRHDSAETIRKALVLGVNVKMITGT